MTSPRRTIAGIAFLTVLCVRAAPSFGQWTEQPGDGWTHVAVYHHATSTTFDQRGRTRPIFNDGRAVTTSVFVTTALGLVPGVDTWAQVPLHRLMFQDNVDRRLRTGIGDPRLYLRLSSGLLGASKAPVAIRGGVKLVGGDFPIDAEIIPLGEGQRDWELMLELGHSFFPMPAYLMGWIGYRWRQPNHEADWEPGNEVFGYAAVGGSTGAVHWKLAAEGWRGESPVIQGIQVRSARRAVFQVLPTLGWQLGPGVLELGVRAPITGRNLPAGPALVLGYFSRWSLW